MSLTKQSAAQERRKKEKRTRKAAQKALYESYRDQGKNGKSKRSRLRNKNKQKTPKTVHSAKPCFNIGCKQCNPCNLPEKYFYTDQGAYLRGLK